MCVGLPRPRVLPRDTRRPPVILLSETIDEAKITMKIIVRGRIPRMETKKDEEAESAEPRGQVSDPGGELNQVRGPLPRRDPLTRPGRHHA